MRRIAIASLMVAALVCASSAAAQKKPKDEVMYAAMMQQFAEMKATLSQLNDRLTAVEGELAKLKQQQTEFTNDLRNAQNVLKTTDTTLSTFRLSSQQDMFSLKTDLAQVRNDLTNLSNMVRANAAASPNPAGPTMQVPVIEGYITEVKEDEVTISVGSNMGVKEGMSLAVFKASDPKGAQIGTIRVKQVLDGTNSRATIIFKKPEVSAFEFSDVVRQM